MKQFYKKVLIASGLLLGAAIGTQAQTNDLQYFEDSAFTAYCPTPMVVMFDGWGQTTGYNPATDSVDIYVNFGDGSDTSFTTPIYGTSPQYYYPNVLHTYMLAGTYTTIIVSTAPGGITDSLSHGPIIVSNGCGTLTGEAYVDNNLNCIFDAGDDTLRYVPLQIIDVASGSVIQYGWTDASGSYSVAVPSNVNLEIEALGAGGLNTTCPVSGVYAVNVSNGGNADNDFGFDCTTSQFDLTTHASGSGFVPGQQHNMYITAGNISCLPQSGTLTLTLDPLVSYVHTVNGPLPTSVIGNVLTWNTPVMAASSNYYGWWSQFQSSIKIETDTTAVVGDTVCHSVSITPTAGDLDISNNTFSYCRPVLASYDPNMKEVSPMGVNATGDVDPNTTFTYTVHFQNTGNYPAQNVYILDTISQHLDMSTFEIVGSSHSMNVLELGNGKIKFEFNGIWLEDSVTNEPESHGHVTYRVKMDPSLPIGTQILNTAYIFFDYNNPIVTNTTLNTIAVLTGVEDQIELEAKLYPNPTNDLLTIEFENQVEGNLTVRDISGRVVQTVYVNSTKAIINANNLAKGFYSADLNGQFIGKFIVN
jgi:uncharacterized repeat protein (TIGR01451 family)